MSARQPSSPAGSPLISVGLVVAALLAVPFFASSYQTILLSYGLIMAIAALALNLLLGYTGLLSFGHSAYFGAAAYAVAFTVKYLRGGAMEAFLAAGLVAGGVIAALFGFVCVRYTRIFFSILTLALSQVLYSLALKFFWVTGGTDGIRVPTPSLLGGLIRVPEDKVRFLAHDYYYYVLIVFALCVCLVWLIVHSPFGKSLQAIRDNEVRAEFVGVRVRRHRWVAFVISGMLTGVAGALWAPLNGLATPDVLYWPFSGELVFMTVLGGFHSFAGPVVGAVAFNYLKTYAIGRTEYWQLLLGVVLVVLVLVMPDGIVGTAARLTRGLRRAG